MSADIFENINPRDKRTEGEEKLLNVLKNSPRFDGWTVFEQPHIDSIKPDFILLNPKRCYNYRSKRLESGFRYL